MVSSEGKANEEDLISLEYETYFAAVFEVAGVALGIVESDGIVSLINDRFEFFRVILVKKLLAK